MITTRTRARLAALLLGLLATGACGDGARRHTSDADTGAAAPATVRDMSATPNAPDSGRPATGAARGDSVRQRGTGVPATKPPGTP